MGVMIGGNTRQADTMPWTGNNLGSEREREGKKRANKEPGPCNARGDGGRCLVGKTMVIREGRRVEKNDAVSKEVGDQKGQDYYWKLVAERLA